MYWRVTSKSLLVLFGLSLLVVVAIAQRTYSSRPQGEVSLPLPAADEIHKPQSLLPSDLKEAQAMKKASSYVATLGLPVPKGFPNKKLTYNQFFQRIWEFQSNEYLIDLDSTSGSLVRFNNYGREGEQVRGHNRQRVHRIQSNAQAKALLWQYARRMGLPPGAYLSEFKAYNDGDPRTADANQAGSINGVFTLPPPGGHAYHEDNGPFLGFRLDPLDGAVVYCAQEWRVYPDKAVTRLSAQQAISAARLLYSEYRSHNPPVEKHQQTFDGVPTTTLKYVMLNFRPLIIHGGPSGEIQKHYPRKARLAWIVRFGKDEIWIDAENGAQLGAIIY